MSLYAPTLHCFMCQGVMFVKDKNRFIQHMNNEHGVIFEVDFLFACCRLNAEQRESFTDMVEDGFKAESGPEFNLESVKEKLGKIIPQLTKKAAAPQKVPVEEEGIEFVTTVSAEESKKRKERLEDRNDEELKYSAKKARKVNAKTKDVKDSGANAENIVGEADKTIVSPTTDVQLPNREEMVPASNQEKDEVVMDDLNSLVKEIQDNLSEADLSVTLGSESSFEIECKTNDSIETDKQEEPISKLANQRETPKRSRRIRGAHSASRSSLTKKIGSESCDICFNSFPTNKGLLIHKSRLHKDVSSPSVKACKVDLKPIKSAEHGLELDEAAEISESEADKSDNDLITRNLFMDNVESDNEDEELTIVDFVKRPVVAEEEGMTVEALKKDSLYFQTHTNMLEQCSLQVKEMFFKELKFLPGWKMRKTVVERGNGQSASVTNFLTPHPSTIVLRSGVAVLEYLRLKGEKVEVLETLVTKMKMKEKNWISYKEQYLKC